MKGVSKMYSQPVIDFYVKKKLSECKMGIVCLGVTIIAIVILSLVFQSHFQDQMLWLIVIPCFFFLAFIGLYFLIKYRHKMGLIPGNAQETGEIIRIVLSGEYKR